MTELSVIELPHVCNRLLLKRIASNDYVEL